ncbi:MAG: exosome complex exonuclease Rrp41 [Candidatus Bathyarchaeota archaeon]|nr:MAG: exosome complex exonuclease Rrp41 [Candidatus Bathyarchaeota archaeon]
MPNKKGVEKLINKKGRRIDGRKFDELRPIKIDVGVLNKANGSAYIEWGKNKILVGVYGPREVHPRHLSKYDKALFRSRYHMAPFSVAERKSPAPSRREHELSKVIRECLEPTIFTELFPRTSIDVFIEVLQAEGGTRCAGITATSVALADAGIPIKDLVVACASGKIDGKIVLDLSDIEDQKGEADMPVAIIPRTGEITLLQMDGIFTQDEFEKALQISIEGCKKINAIQREAIKNKYLVEKASIEPEPEETVNEA